MSEPRLHKNGETPQQPAQEKYDFDDASDCCDFGYVLERTGATSRFPKPPE